MALADRRYVEGFAAAHGLRVEWEGEVGFGRACVGLLDATRDTYVRWLEGAGPVDAPDAYHKDDYLAVLGRGDEAEEQLARWVAHLASNGASFEYVLKMTPDLSTLVYGYVDELAVRVRP